MEYHSLSQLPWVTGTFWVTLAVLVFAFAFGRRIATPVAGMLDSRAAGIRAALEEAAQLKAEAQAMLSEATRRSEQATADAERILSLAHAEATRMAAELTREAEATARRRKEMAQQRIAAAEAAALHEISNIAVDVATGAARQLLRENFAADRNDEMIDHAIAALPAALRQKI